MTKAVATWALALVFVAASGCGDPDEHARIDIDDTEGLDDCFAQQFPFEPSLRAARSRDGRTGIFLQTSPDVKSRNDVAYFQLYDNEQVSTGEAIELATASSSAPRARGKLVFLSSCPDRHDTLELEGTIEFDSFDPAANGVIDGHFTGSAVDPRTGEQRAGEVTGSWRFVVRQGPPYEDFYALPDRP